MGAHLTIRRRAVGLKKVDALVFVAGAVLTLSCCGLDIDDARLPCDDRGGCAVGSSCGSDGLCVADHSQTLGAACASNAQCPVGDLCVDGTCTVACASANAFRQGGCPAREVCLPRRDIEGALTTACTPGDTCLGDEQCMGGVCVDFGAGARLCLEGCAEDLSCTGARSCQPVGQRGFDRLACLPSGPAALGATCDLGAAACARGLICLNNTCVVACGASESCPAETVCMRFLGNDEGSGEADELSACVGR